MPSHVHPWDQIARPSTDGVISTLRVDASMSRDLYWGVDRYGRRMLVLHSAEPLPTGCRPPNLREIELQVKDRGSGLIVALSLVDGDKVDLFTVLCEDLVKSVGHLHSDREALGRLFERARRWHYLLRGGGRLMTDQQQRGLVAELAVLREMAIPSVGAEAAVAAWRGPFGEAQDFRIASHRMEVKATESERPRAFRVSSEYQLDPSSTDGDALWLVLVEVCSQAGEAAAGDALPELVEATRKAVGPENSFVRSEFEQRLCAAGYSDEPGYHSQRWTSSQPVVIAVDADFPSIRASELPEGISGVRYSCDLVSRSFSVASNPFQINSGGHDNGGRT